MDEHTANRYYVNHVKCDDTAAFLAKCGGICAYNVLFAHA